MAKVSITELHGVMQSRFVEYACDEGQHWQIKGKMLQIVDSKGVVKQMRLSSIRYATTKENVMVLSPEIVP